MDSRCILEVKQVSKVFPGVKALDQVNLSVYGGEVHGIMGENGAGKSTLMKILSGIHQPDSGSIFFKGQKITLTTPHLAIKKGIVMIHQELSSILEMTVADNIFMGRQPVYGLSGIVKKKAMEQEVQKWFDELNIKGIHPQMMMSRLSVSQMQMVEIVKAVSHQAEVIIMDEPTSAIADSEVEILFTIIQSLKAKNIGILYISHKMDEIFKITDKISVYRDGQYIGTEQTRDLDMNQLIKMMVGREFSCLYERQSVPLSETVLEVKNLCREGVFQNINFSVKKGEVFGIAGLMGSGRTEIAEAIFGVKPYTSGELIIKGESIKIRKPGDAIAAKIGFATEDRKLQGLFLPLSIGHNTSIVNLGKYCKFNFVNKKQEEAAIRQVSTSLSVKAPSFKIACQTLSGGNQQKVVLAKWLLKGQDILILDEPTRGIDIKVKQEIYEIIDLLTQQGKTIIMISSEMSEIMCMCDRIAVVHLGKITAILSKSEFSQENIMAHAFNIPIQKIVN